LEKSFRSFSGKKIPDIFGKKVSYPINTIPEFFSGKKFRSLFRKKDPIFFRKKNGNFLYFDDEFILLKIKMLN
jgi:hypothetical protein